jgi:ribosome maturation factor RimP
MNIEKRVRELVEEKIADKPNLFIVDIKMHSNGKLIVLIDGDNGLGIDDCVQISRHVGFHLEEEKCDRNGIQPGSIITGDRLPAIVKPAIRQKHWS